MVSDPIRTVLNHNTMKIPRFTSFIAIITTFTTSLMMIQLYILHTLPLFFIKI
jgi:hypothetical protein